MVKIVVFDRDRQRHEVLAAPGETLMEALKFRGGLDIPAICGGCCSCATCHVYVAEEWMARVPPADPAETELLEFAEGFQENSRLSCQITLKPSLEGLTVTLAPLP